MRQILSRTAVKYVLVSASGKAVDHDTVAIACTQAKLLRAHVVILYVIQVRRSLALDADMGGEEDRAEEILYTLQQLARRLGCHVETDLLHARDSGPAIVGEAVRRDAELIVVGVPFKEKFGEFSVEPRAQYVLENAPCRVLLVREPLKTPVSE